VYKFTESEIQVILRRLDDIRKYYNASVINKIESIVNLLRVQKGLDNDKTNELYTLLSLAICYSQNTEDENINGIDSEASTNNDDWSELNEKDYSLTKERIDIVNHVRNSFRRPPREVCSLQMLLQRILNRKENVVQQTNL